MGVVSDKLFYSKPWRIGWGLLSGAIIIVSFGAIFISASHGRGVFALLAITILLPAIVAFSVTLIHELGHVLAVLACGYNVHKVNVQGLSLLPRSKSWPRFSFSKNDIFDGYVVCSPGLPRGALWKDAAISAAGSVANIAAGLLLFALAFTISTRDLALPFLFAGAGAISLCIGVRNLVPSGEAGKWANDGLSIFRTLERLKKGDHSTELEGALARVISFVSYQGKFDLRDVLLIARHRTDSAETSDWYDGLIAQACFSTEHLAYSLQALLRLQASNENMYPPERMQLAFALALVRRDTETATALMQTIDTADRTTNYRFPYSSAVIAQVSGDHDAAVRWLAAMRNVGDKYGARFDDEDLHLIALIESNDALNGLVPNAVE